MANASDFRVVAYPTLPCPVYLDCTEYFENFILSFIEEIVEIIEDVYAAAVLCNFLLDHTGINNYFGFEFDRVPCRMLFLLFSATR